MRWCFALLLVPMVAGQDKTIRLQFQPRQGDKVTISSDFSVALRVPKSSAARDPKVTPSGRPGPSTSPSPAPDKSDWDSFEMKRYLTATLDYEEVVEGRLTKLGAEIPDAWLSEKIPGDRKAIEERDPLHHRSIKVSMANGKLAHQGVHDLSEATLARLTLTFGMEHALLFPDKPVAVGDSWKIIDKDPLFFQERCSFISGFVFLTLEGVKTAAGRTIATISFSQESSSLLKPRKRENIWIDVTVKGEMTVWVERGYVLTFRGTGAIKAKLKTDKEECEGEGEVIYDDTAVLEPPLQRATDK